MDAIFHSKTDSTWPNVEIRECSTSIDFEMLAMVNGLQMVKPSVGNEKAAQKEARNSQKLDWAWLLEVNLFWPAWLESDDCQCWAIKSAKTISVCLNLNLKP